MRAIREKKPAIVVTDTDDTRPSTRPSTPPAKTTRATPTGSPSAKRTTLQVPETPNRLAVRKVQQKQTIGIISRNRLITDLSLLLTK